MTTMVCFFLPKIRLAWKGEGDIQEHASNLYVVFLTRTG